jgi:hypothetical protein
MPAFQSGNPRLTSGSDGAVGFTFAGFPADGVKRDSLRLHPFEQSQDSRVAFLSHNHRGIRQRDYTRR